ncbi:MAG: chemotaxis protein CheX [Vulcanimicrobiaceae bacterium]
MHEDDLKIFVKGTENFFKAVTRVSAEVSPPFIKDARDDVMNDFSAVIGISGRHRGCVYYTAPRDMVGEVMGHFGETDRSDELLSDCVGEIANTISGNAREHLGPGFLISVPVVILSGGRDVNFPKDAPAFVIPITWNGYRSSLILCLRTGEREMEQFDTSELEES